MTSGWGGRNQLGDEAGLNQSMLVDVAGLTSVVQVDAAGG